MALETIIEDVYGCEHAIPPYDMNVLSAVVELLTCRVKGFTDIDERDIKRRLPDTPVNIVNKSISELIEGEVLKYTNLFGGIHRLITIHPKFYSIHPIWKNE